VFPSEFNSVGALLPLLGLLALSVFGVVAFASPENIWTFPLGRIRTEFRYFVALWHSRNFQGCRFLFYFVYLSPWKYSVQLKGVFGMNYFPFFFISGSSHFFLRSSRRYRTKRRKHLVLGF